MCVFLINKLFKNITFPLTNFLLGMTHDLNDLVKNLTKDETPIPPIILTAGAKTNSKRTMTPNKKIFF